jgi:hypothetical protein
MRRLVKTRSISIGTIRDQRLLSHSRVLSNTLLELLPILGGEHVTSRLNRLNRDLMRLSKDLSTVSDNTGGRSDFRASDELNTVLFLERHRSELNLERMDKTDEFD